MDVIIRMGPFNTHPDSHGHRLAHRQYLFYIVLVLALALYAERKKDRRIKLLLSLGLAFCLAVAVKGMVAEPRPCAGLAWCPNDYAFPSTHAAVAFALALGFLNRKPFPLFLAFALFVSFTRLNLGLHVFGDILGGILMALIAYCLVEIAWRRHGRKIASIFQCRRFGYQ